MNVEMIATALYGVSGFFGALALVAAVALLRDWRDDRRFQARLARTFFLGRMGRVIVRAKRQVLDARPC